MSATRIGFIGTGIMGGHMARRLAQAGFALTVWNRSPGKAEALERFGVAVAAEAAGAARDANVVIAMLSSGPVCDEILFGANAVADAMSPGSTLVVMSSIPVETARRQAELAVLIARIVRITRTVANPAIRRCFTLVRPAPARS